MNGYFQWKKDLPYDIVSGFTVAVMHIPQVEKYTFSNRIYTSEGQKNCDAYSIGRRTTHLKKNIHLWTENTIVQTLAQNIMIITTSEGRKTHCYKNIPSSGHGLWDAGRSGACCWDIHWYCKLIPINPNE